jgi:hypothetical protein
MMEPARLHEVEASANEPIALRLLHQTGAFESFQHSLTHRLTQPGGMGGFGHAKFVSNTETQQQLLEPVKSFSGVRTNSENSIHGSTDSVEQWTCRTVECANS